MRITLVDNLVMPEEHSLELLDVHPHLGLLSLAAVAERDGHVVQIYDPKRLIRSGALSYDEAIYDHAAQSLLSRTPDVVGFTTLGCSFLFALNVAARLKRAEPGLPVLLGGPHATMLHREILERFTQFDVIVRYEADEIFPAVLERLESRDFTGIPGVSWRANNSELRLNNGAPKVENLDTLPLLNYDHYPVAELGLDLLRVEAGRGCPFMCTFCSTASFFQRSFRLKSAARLVQELDTLHERYGYVDFKLDHDLFTVNKRKIVEFCEAVKDRNYRWRVSARVDCVDNELLKKMAEAGCVGMYFGIETGSRRMQEIARKRLDVDLVEPTLAVTERLGIQSTASFITGYHEELETDLADTLDLLGRCVGPSCLTQLHMLAPEPGTPMFAAHRDKMEYDGYAGPYNAFRVAPEDTQLVLDHPDIFSTYYYYPAALPRVQYKFAVEAVDALRRLDSIVLKYLLRAFDQKLSCLVFAMRDWAEANGRTELPDAEFVEEFISARFGPRHHLTSLTRYAFQLPNGTNSDVATAEFDPDQRYQLDANVRLLTDMHDCEALIERIKEEITADLLAESELVDRVTYVLTDAAAYRIEPDLQALLSLFEQPRSCREVTDLLAEVSGVDQLSSTYFAPLIDAGILI
ncbi:MAG TPA: radical SAM protein [Pyrinomonadaceae bacterium]|nr:radical SAM protein [Pyrinomonadaceae bacterium]